MIQKLNMFLVGLYYYGMHTCEKSIDSAIDLYEQAVFLSLSDALRDGKKHDRRGHSRY